MKAVTLGILIVCNIVYMLIGGAVFMALESSPEETTKTNTLTTYKDFISSKTCVTDAELETFVKAIISAYDQGVIVTNQTTSASQWDFGNSIFFAMTAVTTIGYGNQTPTTAGGRVFLIFFALIGIPLCLVMLAAVGDKLAYVVKAIEAKECCKQHQKVEGFLKALLIPIVGILIFIFIPSIIFTAIEDWTYGESVYYSIVTLTTIGFGDFVVATDTDGGGRVAYRLLSGLWIFLGLAWLATAITRATEMYQKYMEKVDQNVGKKNEQTENEKADDEKTKKDNAIDTELARIEDGKM